MLMMAFAARISAKTKVDRVASRYVSDVLFHAPLVMFALQRCETSKSLRAFFKQFGIDCRVVYLDSADYRENAFGSRIRARLVELTGGDTLPQLFLGGEHIGSAPYVFDSWRAGVLQRRLLDNGVNYDRRPRFGADTSLPSKLMQQRKRA